uniref:RidA family protein n=1 Tax=Herbidospora sakaeratensis TaxID=564415 RepID=UPI0007863FEB|nr:RidA family protein [Herbidospora sakaeratensis]
MEMIVRNPAEGVYPPSGSAYVHAVEVRDPSRFLYVSGTMGLDPDGTPADSVEEQLALIWANLRAILAEAGMTVDNVVRVTSYLRDVAYTGANAAARVEALGGRPVPTTAIVVQTLDPAWLVELEIVAAA